MVAGPAWIYAGNADEFSASFPQIFAVYTPYLLGASAVILAALILLPLPITRVAAIILAVIGLAAWVQGTFLVHDFGPLDGQNWAIELPWWQTILELIAIATVAFAVWRLSLRAPAIVALLMLLLAVFAVAEPISRISSKPELRDTASTSSLFEFSQDKNFLVVLLDGLPSEIFEEIERDDPNLRSAMEGFTYYPDTASVAYSTVLSIPAIHSGLEYEPGSPIHEFFADGVERGSFMNELSDAGYSTSLVNPLYGVCPARVPLCVRAKTVLTTAQQTVVDEANKLLSMGLFRALPLPLKKTVYNDGRWRQLVAFEDPRTVHHTVEGFALMEEVGKNANGGSAAPTAKFLHVLSTHMPVAVNAECAYVGEQKKTRAGYMKQAKCTLKSFAHMIEGLKKRGVFDNTAVVLLSDHGSGQWKSNRPTTHDDDVLRPVLLARANATLAVKPIRATGPMQRSDRPMSLVDVPGLACSLVADCTKPLPEHREARRYRWYSWRSNASWAKNQPIDVTSYLIKGPVYEGHSWSVEPKTP